MPGMEITPSEITQAVVRIPSGKARLHGTWYAPLSPAGKEKRLDGVAVAFFPLGEERKGCVRVVHELGLQIAMGGWGFLSFDYAGTGESPGGFEEVTWPSVLADADAALRFAMGLYDQHGRRLAGSNSVVFLGIRIGARVAAEAAILSRHKISGFCLWEPVFDGKEWLGELRRRSRFRATGEREQGRGEGDNPVTDIDGYPFSAELCLNLEKLKAKDVAVGDAPCRIIQVSHRTSPSRNMQTLARQLNCGEEIECLRLQPFWLESDLADYSLIINATSNWISSLA